eukprot:TRINITY_DN5478_c0_g1_i3.p1 TRINITY_DN5478_c0_g1~~TRINITY_DN5478_c0_g1_i3.p1  ORF type:complete len:691 (-),score=199.18 TRINITY_DN5478_c0_g1_i3:164-2104(-)
MDSAGGKVYWSSNDQQWLVDFAAGSVNASGGIPNRNHKICCGGFGPANNIWSVEQAGTLNIFDGSNFTQTANQIPVLNPQNSFAGMSSMIFSADMSLLFLVQYEDSEGKLEVPLWLGTFRIGKSNVTLASWINIGNIAAANSVTRLNVLIYDDSKRLLYLASDRGIYVINMQNVTNPSVVRTFQQDQNFRALMPLGDFFAGITLFDNSVLVYNLSTTALVHTIPNHQAAILYEGQLVAYNLNTHCMDYFSLPDFNLTATQDVGVILSVANRIREGPFPGSILLTGVDLSSEKSAAYVFLFNTSKSCLNSTLQVEKTEFQVESTNSQLEENGNAGVIAGAVVGSILGVAILAGIILGIFILKKKKQNSHGNDLQLENQDEIPNYLKQWLLSLDAIKIEEEIGAGAFGRVEKGSWRAAHCAVKKPNQDTTHVIKKEACHMALMRPHPNVIQLLGVSKDPWALVTEYLPEGNIMKFLENGGAKMDEDVIWKISNDVIRGMAHLHAENIVHCDLAARNLLVSLKGSEFTIKISDLGMSVTVPSDDGTVAIRDTTKLPVRWSAPEVLIESKVCKASDVWSFGVTMWEIAENKIPFFTLQNKEIKQKICVEGERLSQPQSIPWELWEQILKCWYHGAAARPTFQVHFNLNSS